VPKLVPYAKTHALNLKPKAKAKGKWFGCRGTKGKKKRGHRSVGSSAVRETSRLKHKGKILKKILTDHLVEEKSKGRRALFEKPPASRDAESSAAVAAGPKEPLEGGAETPSGVDGSSSEEEVVVSGSAGNPQDSDGEAEQELGASSSRKTGVRIEVDLESDSDFEK
jgi:hypothetical protein